MPTKRTPLHRALRWRISPTAVAIWRMVLEIQAQPQNARGELSRENENALRDAVEALAHEVGFSRFVIEPHRVRNEPWSWISDNSLQLERWQQGKEIRDALNAALLAATAAQVPARDRATSR